LSEHLYLGQQLLDQFGSQCIKTQELERVPFEHDWRGRTAAKALAVAIPQTLEEVQALVRWCHHHDVNIVPQGGNTGLCGGSVPSPRIAHPQLILSLSRLKHIRQLDLDNDTLTVEAGCTLQEIQELAEQHDRLFPLSLASEGSCQIGGNLSTNAGGVQVLRYGSMRALTLGLEVVLPDGKLWNGLRGLRKDNTGYDLKQVFIGAEGTLGIITAATLKLFPQPLKQAVTWIALESPQNALQLFHALRAKLGEQISSFELIGRKPLALALKHIPGARDPLPEVHPWQVLVQIDGLDHSECADLLNALLTEQDLIRDALVAQNESQGKAMWALREHLSEAQRIEGPSLKHDISLPMSAIPTFIEQAQIKLEEAHPGISIVCFGHLGDGNLHYNIFPAEAVTTAQELEQREGERISRIILDLVAQLGGSFSAEHGVGQFKVAELARYRDPVELGLMRQLKAAWDPKGIMNPGKIFDLP
jgi:FAD/FMN-containing dehydrogenase